MIDRVRYYYGIFNLIVLPPGLLFWFLIHPWARRWRRLGPTRTYLIVVLVSIAFGALLFRFRDLLLGADLGTNWSLVAVAMVLFSISIWLHLLVPVGYLMIVLEERELIDRFGEEYRKYQREVPRFLPRWRKIM